MGILKDIFYYMQKWGNASSLALLHPECKIFHTPHVDGILAYRTYGKMNIVYGDPLCAPNDIPLMTNAFNYQCQQEKKKLIYTLMSESFTNWALEHHYSSALQFGHDIIINPQYDPRAEKGQYPRLLRQKYRTGIRDGLLIQEYMQTNHHLEQSLQEVINMWLKNRKGFQLYLLPLNIFQDREHKRIFYATLHNEIIGVLILFRIAQGWTLKGSSSMMLPHAPSYLSECMILHAMDVLREEKCNYFSIGPTPSNRLERIEGLGRISQWCLKSLYKTAVCVFDLSDWQKYWKKFSPALHPSYIIWNRRFIGLSEIRGLLKAFNIGF